MKLKYTFETMELDDMIIAVSIDDSADNFHVIIKLNESANEMFKLLKKDITEEKMAKILWKQYDVSYEHLKMYVHKFVEKLKAEGILES